MHSEFSVGDKTVYPAHGVAEVVELKKREIGGHTIEMYVLKIVDTDTKVMVPVKNAGTVGLRNIASAEEVDEIFELLSDKSMPSDSQTWNRRQREYDEKLKTGDVFEIAEVFRDLSLLGSQKDLSFGERTMMENARKLLTTELTYATDGNAQSVDSKIKTAMASNEETAAA